MCGDIMGAVGLEALLAVNGIDLTHCQEALYHALREQCFAQICDILRDDSNEYLRALRFYRQCGNPTLFAEQMVRKYTTSKLDDNSYSEVGKMFRAFFRKDGTRKSYALSVRQHLLTSQNHKCAICNRRITASAELDHIVPWIYVGDELNNNLQLLCHSCNSKKRASSFYPLQALISRVPEDETNSAA